MLTTLDVALSQIGVREKTGRNDGAPAKRYMNGDELPWCAGFLLWCNFMSDENKLARTLTEHYHYRSVATMEKAFIDRGWYSTNLSTIRANDWVFFRHRGASDAGRGRHVGIVERFDKDNGLIHTVEGNLSNKVKRNRYQINDPYVVGYGRLPPVLEGIAPDVTPD